MATEVKRVENNPFRSQLVTPNPTGAGPSSEISVRVSSLQPDPRPRPDSSSSPPSAPPAASSSSSNAGLREPSQSLPRQNRRSADDLADELRSTTLDDDPTPSEPPPAYTPSADPYGEATVEYGPTRPFQPAPPAPPLPQQFTGMSGTSGPLHPQYSGMPPGGPYLSPQATARPLTPNYTGGWGAYPGQATHTHSSPALNRYGPPPLHPQQTGYRPVPPRQLRDSPVPTGNNVSEFARDFYNSPVDGRVSPVHSNASSEGAAGPEHFERVNPPARSNSTSSAPSSTYVPPPRPPPSAASSSSAPSHRPPDGPPPSRTSVENTNDDCKPTTSPTPGRPLLNKGRVLVYPVGYECRKCSNTGYKSFDPTHPCRKCWEKYSKPYSGAITYAPRSAQSQCPLPKFKPPHQLSQSQYPSSSSYPPYSSPIQGTPLRPFSSPFMGLGGSTSCVSLQPQGQPGAAPNVNYTYGPPPPGSFVVKPGDPRIGGRLCWRCDGSGTVSFLIFDVEQCPVCRGIGRIFT